MKTNMKSGLLIILCITLLTVKKTSAESSISTKQEVISLSGSQGGDGGSDSQTHKVLAKGEKNLNVYIPPQEVKNKVLQIIAKIKNEAWLKEKIEEMVKKTKVENENVIMSLNEFNDILIDALNSIEQPLANKWEGDPVFYVYVFISREDLHRILSNELYNMVQPVAVKHLCATMWNYSGRELFGLKRLCGYKNGPLAQKIANKALKEVNRQIRTYVDSAVESAINNGIIVLNNNIKEYYDAFDLNGNAQLKAISKSEFYKHNPSQKVLAIIEDTATHREEHRFYCDRLDFSLGVCLYEKISNYIVSNFN